MFLDPTIIEAIQTCIVWITETQLFPEDPSIPLLLLDADPDRVDADRVDLVVLLSNANTPLFVYTLARMLTIRKNIQYLVPGREELYILSNQNMQVTINVMTVDEFVEIKDHEKDNTSTCRVDTLLSYTTIEHESDHDRISRIELNATDAELWNRLVDILGCLSIHYLIENARWISNNILQLDLYEPIFDIKEEMTVDFNRRQMNEEI